MESNMDRIKSRIKSKSCLKQDVYKVTQEVFRDLKTVLGEVANDLHDYISPKDERIVIELKTTGAYESQMTLAGDTVTFHMHTNVFTFPDSHHVHRSPYVQKNPSNAYCGVINMYNFLTDSHRFNRLNDTGYLVGRIFVNKDRHFFVEGQQQLGFLFNDFTSSELTKETLRQVVETALIYVLDFDLYSPPYQTVKEVTLDQVQALSQDLKLKTGKRLGFRFQSEDKKVRF